MDRLLAASIAAIALFTLGCASTPPVAAPATTAHVEAGPPCESLHARIHRAEVDYASQAGTWLDAPNRMVESRRLRALHARAARLGCALPQI